MTSFIEDSVRRQLAAQQDVETSGPTTLPMVSGDGLLPGVDLDNNATLLELMGMSS